MKNSYRSLLLFITMMLSACSTADFHAVSATNSMVTSTQIYHLKHIKNITSQRESSNKKVCYHYPQALGAYSAGCRNRVIR